jgi:hypothetical protein
MDYERLFLVGAIFIVVALLSTVKQKALVKRGLHAEYGGSSFRKIFLGNVALVLIVLIVCLILSLLFSQQ